MTVSEGGNAVREQWRTAGIDFWCSFAKRGCMRLLAAAKINLHLRIGAARADGFHPLSSWFVTIGLFDTLICEPIEGNDLRLNCDDPSIPTDDRNLVVRVARLLQKEHAPVAQVPEAKRGARLTLQKQIPAGGGLGGGSSDAARTIVALNHAWQLGLTFERMCEIAASVGSDVPFFLHGGSCLCRGRGEIVTPLPAPKPKWALLILPEISMPTAAVYRMFDQMGLGEQNKFEDEANLREWSELSAHMLLEKLKNDLESPAFEMNEALRRLRSETQHILGRIVRMSGSGSTLFTLFDDETGAIEAKRALSVRSVVAPIAPAVLDDLAVV